MIGKKKVMEEIKEFVFNDVAFQLETYHNISVDAQLEENIYKVIDKEYDNFIKSTQLWEPDPYIEHVVNTILESKNEAN